MGHFLNRIHRTVESLGITTSLSALALVTSFGCSSGEVKPQAQVEAADVSADDSLSTVQRAAQPIVVNPGFAHQVLASGLSDTTAMAVAADGRVFVAQKNGVVRVIKNGALLTTPLMSLTVNQTGERGLIGIALDPNFASNGYVYLNYTTTTTPHNRISRFTAVGDVAALNTEAILVDGMPALTSGIHVAGAIHFGNDGKLYMAHGDNETPSRSQDLNHPYGKLLRFNADGSIPTDNPFYNTSTGIARAVWAYGLRNPYTFAVQKSTGKIYVNDVSLDGPEEIYDVQPGANYGWGGTNPGPAPVYSYPLDAGRCAITGGVFYESQATNFPTSFQGKYFFSDYCAGQIWFMNADGTGVTSFADDSNSELVQPVDLDIGVDGSLYYLQRGSGAKVGRIYNPVPSCTTDAQCSNNDVCDGIERCVNNICQGGTSLSCDDGNQCTTNTCNPVSGCNFPNNGTCCVTNTDCNDSNSCTTDACVSGQCQYSNSGTCNPCVKMKSQRTNNYLVLDASNQMLPTGNQAGAQIFEKIPSGSGFKFKNRTNNSYMRLVSNNLTVDTTDANAVVFTEHDCSSAGTYPGGKGYSSPTGSAPHWKAQTTTGPIMSGSGGNATSCANGSATSWERFYPETVTCPGAAPVCGDSACNGTETCGSCASDCGTCPAVCGDHSCNNGENCSSCPNDCGACGPVCGDGSCNGSETCSTCAGDCGTCPPVCGDGTCNGAETCSTCAGDCGVCPPVCGDGTCNGAETCSSCSGDCGVCPPACGDGNCNGSETCSSCAGDCGVCPPVCGDGSCNGSETCTTCSGDCGVCPPACGDGNCNGSETCGSCATDCGACSPNCGDGTCDTNESCSSCSADCGACPPVCGDGTCNGSESCSSCATDCGSCPPACGDGSCNGLETCNSCATDCGICEPTCGDGTCNGMENCGSCATDCGACPPVCGDGTCNGTETCGSCSGDCGACSPICGDGSCNGTETCSSCAGDCGVCPPVCGDGTCNGAETCGTCATDCGSCPPACGDGTCNGLETCSICSVDCGTCAPTCGDGMCNGSETCTTCGTDCGTCPAVCGDASCNGTETCSTCASDCGACSTTTRREAELATLVGALITNEASSSGGKYVDGEAGAKLTWTQSASAGSATLKFAIRSPSGTRSMGVYVNNVKVGVVTTTTVRPTWAVKNVTATLVSGNNTVELRDSESTTEPDIDYLELTTGNPGPVCGDNSCNGTETCSTCAADCGVCSTCGNGVCSSGETCSTCQVDCGGCVPAAAKLTMTHVSNSGGWSNVAGLTDGNLTTKLTSNTTPNCIEYSLGGARTITSARLLEDNAGTTHVDTWKVQYKNGANFVDAIAYTNTPNAMPTWNTLDFTDVAGVSSVRVCMQNNGAVEAAEFEVWGFTAPSSVCGDRTCNGPETCVSCPWDCNTCTGSQLGLDSRPSNTACVAGSPYDQPPLFLSDSPCVVSVANPPVFSSGVLPFAIAETFWSDSALKTRFMALPNNTKFAVQSNGDWNLPPGGVTIKNFQWQGQYFETRFFVRYTDGSYGAWTYMWNDTQDEAFLVDPVFGDTKVLPGGYVWEYPTEEQCFRCHTSASGFSLGLETRQLNFNQVYPSTGRNANQFDTLKGIGMLSTNPTRLSPIPSHNQASVSLQMRADAYLHANCANCHRPGGPGYGNSDFRFDTLLANKNICNKPSIMAAYPDLDLLEPGNHASSVLWLRMSQREADFMPPIGSGLSDAEGATILQQWIDSLTTCPAP